MKLIDISTPLHPGVFAMVDDADFEALNQWKWSAEKREGTFYAVRSVRGQDGKKTTIRMHRQIAATPDCGEVDHADGNGLNNQRGNLRPCSVAKNQQNRARSRGVSQFKGVLWDKSHSCWKAKIIVDGKYAAKKRVGGNDCYIGTFDTAEDAERAYLEFRQ